MYKVAVFATLAVCIACMDLSAQDMCSPIVAHGLWDHSDWINSTKRTQAFLNWLSQDTFDKFQNAKDVGGQIGVPIDDIPVAIDGHDREKEWHEYQSSLRTLQDGSETFNRFQQLVVDKADPGIIAAWSACTANSRGFTQILVEQGFDARQFTVKLTYDPVGPPPFARVASFDISPPTVVCKPSIKPVWWWFAPKIKSEGKIFNCTRSTLEAAVQVTGNTSKGTIQAKLPGLRVVGTAKVEPVKPVVCDFGYAAIAHFAVSGGIAGFDSDSDPKHIFEQNCPVPAGKDYEVKFQGTFVVLNAQNVQPARVDINVQASGSNDNGAESKSSAGQDYPSPFVISLKGTADGGGVKIRVILTHCQSGGDNGARCSLQTPADISVNEM
jgi:hypothetical protein